MTSKGNHVFSFAGGELLAGIAAWWFVSFSYYLYVDRTHLGWRAVSTADYRRKIYYNTQKYHSYWLLEVLDMNNLDVHGNSAGISGAETKRMAEAIIAKRTKAVILEEAEALYGTLVEKLDRQRTICDAKERRGIR